MLSLVDASGKRTAACALRNCAYLFPLGMLATWLGVTTPYFAYESGGCRGPEQPGGHLPVTTACFWRRQPCTAVLP